MKLYFHPVSTVCRPIMLLAGKVNESFYQHVGGGYKDGKFLGL